MVQWAFLWTRLIFKKLTSMFSSIMVHILFFLAGLMMWGYSVIATIGKKITELTPTRGFAAEFAAASVVLFASKLGLPISATHTLVGAVMGVGFARGLNSVRAETVKEIVVSWAVTIPVGAVFAVFYTWLLTKLLSFIL